MHSDPATGVVLALAVILAAATLTASSVGITARVLKDLGRSQSADARVATAHLARFVAAILLLSASVACQSAAPRYKVTTTPLDLIGRFHPGHCIAIDPTDPQGVWTWEPAVFGSTPTTPAYVSGCSKRSTDVRRPDRAKVTNLKESGAVEVHFQIQLQIGGPRDISLVLQDGVLRNAALGTQVATEQRTDLNVPDMSVR